MAMTIENPETEKLAAEVAELAGESEEEAVRKALEARKRLLTPGRPELSPAERAEKVKRFWKYLEEEVWPNVPAELREKGISKEEREEILGYGPEGV